MEGARTADRAAAIDHHDHEAQFGHGLKPERVPKLFGTKKALRAGVDELNDRILLRRIEIRRAPDQSIDIGRTVGGFPGKRLGEFPSCLLQLRWRLSFRGRGLLSRLWCGEEPFLRADLDGNSCRQRRLRPAKHSRSGRHSPAKVAAIPCHRTRCCTGAPGTGPRPSRVRWRGSRHGDSSRRCARSARTTHGPCVI